jgi:hypothetical protein
MCQEDGGAEPIRNVKREIDALIGFLARSCRGSALLFWKSVFVSGARNLTNPFPRESRSQLGIERTRAATSSASFKTGASTCQVTDWHETVNYLERGAVTRAG